MAPVLRGLHPRLRAFLGFALSLIVSLVVGALFEAVTDRATLDKAYRLQQTAMDAVSAFEPLDFGARYLDALGVTGFRAAAPPPAPFPTGIFRDLPRYDLDPPPVPAPAAAAVAAGAPQPALAHWADRTHLLLRPGVALADVVWHMFNAWTAAHIAILAAQLCIGFLLTLVLLNWWDEDLEFLILVAFVPFATVLFGTLTALAGQWLMIAGLYAFGRLVGLAGICCSTGGLAFAGYKLAMKRVEDRVEKLGQNMVQTHAFGEPAGGRPAPPDA